jgi:hypothetical protein
MIASHPSITRIFNLCRPCPLSPSKEMAPRYTSPSLLLVLLLSIQAISLEAFGIAPPITTSAAAVTTLASTPSLHRIHDPQLVQDVACSALTSSPKAISVYEMTAASSFSSSSSSVFLSAVTVDPTTFLNDLFAGVAGTPELLLAVPILAAVSLVSLLVYALVSYASPAEPDD